MSSVGWKSTTVSARQTACRHGSMISSHGMKSKRKTRMAQKTYGHSAYWYAYHYGWTYNEAKTYTGKYLDIHSYRPRMRERPDGVFRGRDWFRWREADKEFDSTFNPLLLCVCAMVDVGIAMRDKVSKFADPVKRDRMKRELMQDLRRLRRPFYYARETERRRELAAARRKVTRRATTAPMPTPDEVLAAWNARKDSREAMIRLGGMLQDLECYVDNCLRFGESGEVVGRNGGIKGWLFDNLPELLPTYKTLMRYKAMAVRLRQATGTRDPKPTSALLEEMPHHGVVAAILADSKPVFSRVFSALEHMLSPDTVFLDATNRQSRGKRREGTKGIYAPQRGSGEQRLAAKKDICADQGHARQLSRSRRN